MTSSRRLLIILCAAIIQTAPVVRPPWAAADSANVTLPTMVSFQVSNVNLATTGSPDPTLVSFEDASIPPGYAVRISIQANSTDFTPPVEAGTTIPASYISWTTSGSINGTGYSGTLSATSFTVILLGNTNATSASTNVSWTLDPLPEGVRAGSHTLNATWKIESLVP